MCDLTHRYPDVFSTGTHLRDSSDCLAINTSSNGGVRPLLNQTCKNSPPLISTFLLRNMTAKIVAHSATECQTVLFPFFLIGFLFVSFFASVSPRSVSDNPSSPIVFVLLCASRKKETGGVVAPPGKEEEETGGTGSSDLPASVRPTSQPRRQEAPVCTHHRADSQDAGSFVHRQKGRFCSARGSRERRKRRGPPPGEGGLFLLVFCCRRRKARSSKPPSSTCPSESHTLPTFKTPSALSPDKKRQETLLWKKGKTEERDLPHRKAGKLRKERREGVLSSRFF